MRACSEYVYRSKLEAARIHLFHDLEILERILFLGGHLDIRTVCHFAVPCKLLCQYVFTAAHRLI